jgi:hypothetical protein
LARQDLPEAHLPQVAPPQSMSVSVPFLTTSVQVAAWHRFGAPEQTPLWQSPATVQSPFVAHPPQVPPPQSTSVSAPFSVPSVHVGAWHTPPEQTLL